jgi:hypothetical protein
VQLGSHKLSQVQVNLNLNLKLSPHAKLSRSGKVVALGKLRARARFEAKLAKSRSEAARDTPDHDAYNVQSARSTEEAKPAHAMGLFEVHVD